MTMTTTTVTSRRSSKPRAPAVARPPGFFVS
jgi:hypothetical protein